MNIHLTVLLGFSTLEVYIFHFLGE